MLTPPRLLMRHPQQGSPQHATRRNRLQCKAAGVAAKAVPAGRDRLTAMILAKSAREILRGIEISVARVTSWWRRFGSKHPCTQGTICRRRVDQHRP